MNRHILLLIKNHDKTAPALTVTALVKPQRFSHSTVRSETIDLKKQKALRPPRMWNLLPSKPKHHYCTSHIIFKVIKKELRNAKKIKPSGILFIACTFTIFTQFRRGFPS